MSPDTIRQEIAAADNIERLRSLCAKIPDIVDSAISSDADIKSTVQFISRLNDLLALRLIALLERDEDIRLPEGAAYLALGSQGRGEQTLSADQDSAIVYRDDLSPEELRDIERFAHRLVDALEGIGFPRCPGNIMASDPRLRLSLTEWQRLLDEWITIPSPENMLKFGIFQDLRPLYGDALLGTRLRDHIRITAMGQNSFFTNMALHAVRFPSPLTFFGRIRVERTGENKGMLDIKKAGIFAITLGVSLLALEAGIIGGTTWDKLALLGKRKILTAGDSKIIEEAFTFLIRLRLQMQLRELSTAGSATNYIDPGLMSDSDRSRFMQALNGVTMFLRVMNDRYRLNFISA